jgi:hypothetical protein
LANHPLVRTQHPCRLLARKKTLVEILLRKRRLVAHLIFSWGLAEFYVPFVDQTDARNRSGMGVSEQAFDTNCRTPGRSFRKLTPRAQIMHTRGQGQYENEHKAIGPQDFRPSTTAELPKQTALQRTAPTPMRDHNPSMLCGGMD